MYVKSVADIKPGSMFTFDTDKEQWLYLKLDNEKFRRLSDAKEFNITLDFAFDAVSVWTREEILGE